MKRKKTIVQETEVPWIIEWVYNQPVVSRAVAIGRTKEEAQSGIVEAFEGAPGLEFRMARLLTEEDKQEMGEDADDKLVEMIAAYRDKKQNLN